MAGAAHLAGAHHSQHMVKYSGCSLSDSFGAGWVRNGTSLVVFAGAIALCDVTVTRMLGLATAGVRWCRDVPWPGH